MNDTPMELPDFHIPHAEKIEWMIETNGWALEPVEARPDTDPPTPAYAYSIGMSDAVAFPDVAVFGLTPVAANGLVTLVADACRGGTEIPLGVELVGLLDNELRCCFPVTTEQDTTIEMRVSKDPKIYNGGAAFQKIQRSKDMQ